MTFLGPIEKLKCWSHANPNFRRFEWGAERRETDGDATEAAANIESRYVFHPFKSDGGLE